MRTLLTVWALPPGAWIAAAMCAAALGLVMFLLVARRPARLSLARRRPGTAPERSPLSGLTARLTDAIAAVLAKRGTKLPLLELAGVQTRPQDLILLVLVGAAVAGVFGTLLLNVAVGLLLAAMVPVVVRLVLGLKVSRRRRAFADQLDDTLQLMSGSLRAGHSVLQTFASVAVEAEEPTATEISRIVNETRVGRDLTAALTETADRMANEDFVWVAQAIAINREVGGNLGEVLDHVGVTIRERNQIRRQVKALSAEGRMSAWVLMGLPIVIGGFLGFTSPSYMLTLTQSLVGWVMIIAAAVMFAIGGVWLNKVTTIKF